VSFSVHVQQEDGEAVVRLVGALDLGSAPRLNEALVEVEGQAPGVVVLDLRDLTFLDSTGLQAIIAADQRARRSDRALELVPGPPNVQRVFRLTLMDQRLSFRGGT
jgi:anti-sigma B factor antagonist